MKIFILGSGALGSLIGARLSKLNEVMLYSINKNHIEKINKHGLKIEELDGRVSTFKLNAVSNKDIIDFSPDLVIITLKTYSLEQGLLDVYKKFSSNCVYLTLQNGIGNIEKICSIVSESQVIAGVTGQGATLVQDGFIRHGGNGITYIGEISGEITERAKNITDNFNACGLETYSTDNIQSYIWKKLLVNIGINAITAIARVKNGYIAHSKWANEISRLAVSEAAEVAKQMGIDVDHDIFKLVIDIAQKTQNNISSMHQDIINKKPTEIDSINGAIVEYGEKLNIDTPVNKVLTNLIKLIEEKQKGENDG